MQVLVATAILCALFAIGAALSGAQQKSILDEHNKWRKLDSKGVAPPLVWDAKLASVAQAYADKCIFAHNGNRVAQAGYANVGENLYFSSKTSLGDDLSGVVDSWDGEKKDYTLSANTCKAGKMCGHYTQVVWKDTKKVGCGMKSCASVSPFGRSGTIVVCDYNPAGNWVGQKPFEVVNERKSVLEALLQMLLNEEEETAEIEMVGEALVQE